VYLRRNSKTRKGGRKVENYQIAHNRRDPETRASKPIIIWNGGRIDDPKVQEGLKELSLSIAREYELQVYDPADPRRTMKASKSNVIISLEEIRQAATEKLAFDPNKIRKGMVELCKSVAKTFNFQVHDPADPKSQEPPSEEKNNQHEKIEVPIDSLRQAAIDLNTVLGLKPKIDPNSDWSYDHLVDLLRAVSEFIDISVEIEENTFLVLSNLGLLTKETIKEFKDTYIRGKSIDKDNISIPNDVNCGLTTEQLQKAALDLNTHLRFVPKIDPLWPNRYLISCFAIGLEYIKPNHVIEEIFEENTWLVLSTLGVLSPEVIDALKSKYPDLSIKTT
jgi:hypothetical protein